MAGKTFAAINVGSNEISMKICEITPRKGARELDTVKRLLSLEVIPIIKDISKKII